MSEIDDDAWRDAAMAGRLSRRVSEVGSEVGGGIVRTSSTGRNAPDLASFRTASFAHSIGGQSHSRSGSVSGQQQQLASMSVRSMGSRGPSRAASISGGVRSMSSVSQLAMMSLNFMEDRADRMLVSDSIDQKTRDAAKQVVLDVYMRVFGHTPEPAEMLHYVACLLQDEPLDKRGVVQQVLSSFNYKLHQREQMSKVPLVATSWRNRLYPWLAVEDEADEEMGTVKWANNDERAEDKRWETHEFQGGCLGAEVLYGKFFNSTKDAWTTAAMKTGLKNGGGVYVWHVKKIQASQCGNKARLGVILRNCELDQSYRRSHFANRAWFMDEDGDVWNGDALQAKGTAFWNQNSVVTFRLDDSTPGERELSLYVRYMQSEDWEQQLAFNSVPLPPPCAVIRDLPPGKEMYPFVQDYYSGSGFEVSQVTTLSVDEEGRKQFAAILGQADTLLNELCPPEPKPQEDEGTPRSEIADLVSGSVLRVNSSR